MVHPCRWSWWCTTARSRRRTASFLDRTPEIARSSKTSCFSSASTTTRRHAFPGGRSSGARTTHSAAYSHAPPTRAECAFLQQRRKEPMLKASDPCARLSYHAPFESKLLKGG